MRFNRIVIMVLAVAAIASTATWAAENKKKPLFYRNPMRADVTSPVPAKDEMGMDYVPVYAEEEKPAAKPASKKPVYVCPMHPQVVSDKPGDCPICHMRLVLRDDAAAGAAHLESAKPGADPNQVCVFHDCPMEAEGKPCPMMIVGEKGETVECPVCHEKLKLHEGELSGTFVPAGYASVLISPEKQQLIGIRTALVGMKELVRPVSAPARVAYDPELYQLQIDYLKEYRIAQGTLRGRELAFKNLQDSRWEAPRIDLVKSKLLRMGMDEESLEELVRNAKADESLLYLKPGGDVWIFIEVSEMDAPFVKKGDPVTVEIPSMPGKTYAGDVHHAAAAVDPRTRRVHVHVKLKNEDGLLKPDMLVNATIESAGGRALAVPAEAVFFTGTASVVFVDKGQGLFEPRDVRVGAKAGREYPVLSGLSEGERVVVNGNFLLDSESKLKSSVEKAVAAAREGEPR